jgi:hypothetical protein
VNEAKQYRAATILTFDAQSKKKDSETKVGNALNGRNKIFALGPEVDLALAKGGKLYGFLKVNYQWTTYARVAPQGSELTLMATFLVKPIKLPSLRAAGYRRRVGRGLPPAGVAIMTSVDLTMAIASSPRRSFKARTASAVMTAVSD